MKKIKKHIEKMVVKAAYNAAEKNANSVCGFFFYQPKQSDAVVNWKLKFQPIHPQNWNLVLQNIS